MTTMPYQHQMEALKRAWGLNGFAYFLEMGTGKSKIIVDEIVNLIERDMIDIAIIVAPNNVHVNWKSELLKHGPVAYDKWAIQIWRSGVSLEKKEKETIAILESGKVLIFLINIEALSTPGGQKYVHRLLHVKQRGYMAIDESHKIKTPTAARTKACIALGGMAKIRRIATGTEAEEGLENLYSQFRFLDINIIGQNSFTSFKHMYCIENQNQKVTGQIYRSIVGYQNKDHLAKKIAPYIYQKRKKECLDLPDKVYVTHEIDLTKEQHHIYTKLKQELLYELETGKLVDATLAITRMIRLQQVLCGHLNSSDDPKQSEYIPSNRANFVSEIVEEASGKVIIFCRFIKDVEIINTELDRAGIGSLGLSSLVEGRDRIALIDKWRQEPSLKALVMTISTGGTGLTLNEANTTIFYSNAWSSTDRIQAEDRNHRIGQHDKVTYHDIIVPRYIDHQLLLALLAKRNVASEFRNNINMIKEFI